MRKIVIIDYFAGNIFSVKKAFESLDCRVEVSDDARKLKNADSVVLPGVGAFADGMSALNKQGMNGAITDFVRSGKPFLGICLGMQLLFDSSQEFGFHKGFGLVPGEVRRLPDDLRLKIPNIGWHSLALPDRSDRGSWKDTLLGSTSTEENFYFIHSFAAYPKDPGHWLSRTYYGEHAFCSTVRKDNIAGCQYHPEKSGRAGLNMLAEFLRK